MKDKDTIVAISTPPGSGAIGIVRMSGPGSRRVLSNMWISNQNPVENFITHRLYYGKISTRESAGMTPESEKNNIIDNVLAVWMGAPHSYTGEDVVEIHCHGGSIPTRLILRSALLSGARMAEPGEFTRRAFMNGKLDLAQAEAVADMICATSEKALKMANEQMAGRLSRSVHEMLDIMKEAKALIEASIDFPEEEGLYLDNDEIKDKLSIVRKDVTALLSTYGKGRLIHDGVKVVIVGKPNVGKSSILNALLGEDRAIVHHSAGTTRDTIEEKLEIGGVLFSITDTAGIRNTSCELERLGIEKAKGRISSADIALVVIDASERTGDDDSAIINETEGLRRIIALNKSDLVRSCDHRNLKLGNDAMKISTSAVTGEGIDKLRDALLMCVDKNVPGESEGPVITSLRHKDALEEALYALDKALGTIDVGESAEFTAEHVQAAVNALMKITGEITTDDVLNEIFSRFCIGK